MSATSCVRAICILTLLGGSLTILTSPFSSERRVRLQRSLFRSFMRYCFLHFHSIASLTLLKVNVGYNMSHQRILIWLSRGSRVIPSASAHSVYISPFVLYSFCSKQSSYLHSTSRNLVFSFLVSAKINLRTSRPVDTHA